MPTFSASECEENKKMKLNERDDLKMKKENLQVYLVEIYFVLLLVCSFLVVNEVVTFSVCLFLPFLLMLLYSTFIICNYVTKSLKLYYKNEEENDQ